MFSYIEIESLLLRQSKTFNFSDTYKPLLDSSIIFRTNKNCLNDDVVSHKTTQNSVFIHLKIIRTTKPAFLLWLN